MSMGIDFPGYVEYLVDDGMDTRPATSMALEAYRANILMFENLTAFFVAQAAFTKKRPNCQCRRERERPLSG